MRLPFGKKNEQKAPEDEVLLALDIGTSFVKAVIYQKQNNEVHVKGYAKVKQQVNAMRGAMVVNIQKVVSVCDLAIGEALAMADKIIGEERGEENYESPVPSNVVLGIAGELVKGVAIIVNYERENPEEKITQDEVNEVVESVKEQAFTGVVSDIADEIGVDISNIVEINTSINSTYIDGIRVDNPEGFIGKEVSYRVFTIFAPSIHLNSLKEIASALQLEIDAIEVEPYAIAKAINTSRKQNFSGIIIDIGGGTTDIALIDNANIIGTKMFAFGGDVFTKRMEVDYNKDFPEAEKLKMDYSNMKLDETMTKKVKASFAKDIPVWVEGVEVSLSDFEDMKNYPADIFICGGGSELPDIKTGLIEYPWLQVLPFQKYPRTSHLYPNQLERLIDHTKKLVGPSDVAPVALALSTLE